MRDVVSSKSRRGTAPGYGPKRWSSAATLSAFHARFRLRRDDANAAGGPALRHRLPSPRDVERSLTTPIRLNSKAAQNREDSNEGLRNWQLRGLGLAAQSRLSAGADPIKIVIWSLMARSRTPSGSQSRRAFTYCLRRNPGRLSNWSSPTHEYVGSGKLTMSTRRSCSTTRSPPTPRLDPTLPGNNAFTKVVADAQPRALSSSRSTTNDVTPGHDAAILHRGRLFASGIALKRSSCNLWFPRGAHHAWSALTFRAPTGAEQRAGRCW